eukprot:2567531-Prymnesium_polylepis.1
MSGTVAAVSTLQFAWRRHLDKVRTQQRADRYEGMVSLLRSAGVVKPGAAVESSPRSPVSSWIMGQRAAAEGSSSAPPARANGAPDSSAADELVGVLCQLRDGLRLLDDDEAVRAGTMRTLCGVMLSVTERLQHEHNEREREASALAWALGKARAAAGVDDDSAIAPTVAQLRSEVGATYAELVAVREELAVSESDRMRLELELEEARSTARAAHEVRRRPFIFAAR